MKLDNYHHLVGNLITELQRPRECDTGIKIDRNNIGNPEIDQAYMDN